MLELISRGGMGEVWSARDRRLHRNVALKFISMDFARNRAARDRFEREARAAAALNHPNICTIYDVGETAGQPFLAMELLEGETLEHRLAEQSVPVDSLVNWGIEIADALEAAHSHGIVHSDLKPGNLFLTTRGQTRILEFGLARLASERNDRTEKVTAGTPGYMSPEQIKGEPLDPRSDIFSLGIVLYRAASGRLPERKPGPPSSYNRQVPPELDRIIAKALEADRDVRYQHASEVRADLKRLKRDSNGRIASDPAIAAKPDPQPVARPRRPGWVIGGAVALLLVAAAALAWHFSQPSGLAFREFSIVRASDSQNVQLTAISPDGKYLATVHKDAKGGQTLWVRHLASNSDRRLWEDPRYLYKRIVFSPDSSYICFRSAALDNPVVPGANHDDIFRIPVIGGEPINLIHGADSQFSFYDNGQRLCFYRGDYSDHQFFFIGASAEGGDEKVLSRVPGTLPSVSECSPDGTEAALTYLTDKMDILDFATGRIEPLLKPGGVSGPIYVVNWTSDGKGMMVSSTRTSVGLAQLGFVAWPSGEFHEITHNLNTYLHGVSFTADGRRMATTEGREETSFSLAPLADPSKAKDAPFTWADSFIWLGAGKLLAAGADSTLKLADLSAPEGSALPVPAGYFFNDPAQCGANSIVASGGTLDGSTRGIFSVGLDGGGFRQLTTGRGDVFPMCSVDGAWLLYVKIEDGQHHTLERMPRAGGSPQTIGANPGVTSVFSLSPDGKLAAQMEYPGFAPVMKILSTATW
jgi:serine/threonine protein kinase